jgi:hypothetical protein
MTSILFFLFFVCVVGKFLWWEADFATAHKAGDVRGQLRASIPGLCSQ